MQDNTAIYRLEVTREQLRLIDLACEICGRAKIGQVASALRMLSILDCEGRNVFDSKQELDNIVSTLTSIISEVRDTTTDTAKFNEAEVMLSLHEVIRHKLSWDKAKEIYGNTCNELRNWNIMPQVRFDEPMKWGNEPLAVLTGPFTREQEV